MKIIRTLSSLSNNSLPISKTMNLMLLSFLSLSSLLGSCNAETEGIDDKIMLEDFSYSSGHSWTQMNDPVMGGKSTGKFKKTMKGEDYVGSFVGHVADVPFLKAPGFIKAETSKGESWPDISSCKGIEFALESHTDYDGLRVSFGENHPDDAMPYTYGYKADLKVPMKSSSSVSVVQIPFTDFTDKWDAATGNAITTCEENREFCPDKKTLSNKLYSIAIWGEGVEGGVEVDLYSIQAYGCSSSSSTIAITTTTSSIATTTTTNSNSNQGKKEFIDEYEFFVEEIPSSEVEDIASPKAEYKASSTTEDYQVMNKTKKNKMLFIFGFIVAAFYVGSVVRSKGFMMRDQRRMISVMDYDSLADKEIQLV